MIHFIVKSIASQSCSVNKRDRKRNARENGQGVVPPSDEEHEETKKSCCVEPSSGHVRSATSPPIYNQTTPADLPYTN